MELFAFRHGGASFAAGKDDALHFLRNGKLRLQRSGSSLEGRNARGDVITHVMLVEIVHLFLNGAVDTGIARMQANYEFAFIIEFLH